MLRVYYPLISVLFFNGAEIFFFYLFALAPGGVFVFALADPDVAEVIFSIAACPLRRDNDYDLAGCGVLINSGRNVPESLPARMFLVF